MSNCVVIVQARAGSSRLPGKVLLDIAGRTVLAHVLERCRAIPSANAICCAIPDTAQDNAVAAEAKRCGVEVFRGSERDVLSRYVGAANMMKADEILRITSDCPLLDPDVCEKLIGLRRQTGAGYAANDMTPSWPHGLDCEVFTAEWLERAGREAVKPSHREHVTLFMREHPEARSVNLDGPGGALASHRWTLDTEADYRLLQVLVPLIPRGAREYDYRSVLGVLEQHPELSALNAGQDRYAGLRKSLAEDEIAVGKNSG